jgi:hypothetical protein
MKTLKDFLEARMIATGDFKVSASGRKVRRLIKVGDDAYNKADDIDKDGDVDADDEKAKKMRGESVEQVEEGWYEKPASAYRRKGDEIGGGSPTNFSPNSRASLAKNSKAPVAPVPDKKYIKGTPEHQALKAKSKPINGMPTNKMKEEVEHIEEATVKSQSYSWGTMKTVHHGKDFSIPLHPEHHKPIAALKHGESHSFKDETGNKWKATRDNDTVHFHGGSYGTQKTSVKHDTMKESVEITEAEEHLVHVSDGSKYDEEPHPKDVDHVMAGAKKHGGEFDGHSDKGAYFKFKSHDDAKNFKKHVDSCPNRSCSADLHESTEQVNEASDKQDSRLLQLARLGLLDKADVALFRNAMQTFKADKQLSIKQRNMLLAVYNDLVNMVTGDDAMFARAKLDVQKEETEQLDEISKATLASYIPKAAKDARIHGQIASDFAARGKTARKPGSKQSWERLSQKYKEKAWKRDDGIAKAVNKLTKEETDLEEGKRGLWDNIHAKRKRIAAGSGEKMRKPGSKGAPTAQDFKDASEETQVEGYYKDIDTNNKETERLSGSWKKETPWRKIKPGSDSVKDKSGAVHTPMSKVRHLARLALKKTSGK